MTHIFPKPVGQKALVFPWAVLMLPDEILSLRQAAAHARRNEKTIRRWVKIYGIGRKSAQTAPIEVSRPALDMVLQGRFDVLEKLRRGERNDPDVLMFFDLAGLPGR